MIIKSQGIDPDLGLTVVGANGMVACISQEDARGYCSANGVDATMEWMKLFVVSGLGEDQISLDEFSITLGADGTILNMTSRSGGIE